MRRSTWAMNVTPALALSAALGLAGCSSEAEPGNGTDQGQSAQVTTEGATTTVVNAEQSESDVVLRYAVSGMHCGGCAQTIASKVATLEGVTSCEASFEQGTAVVHVSDPAIAEQVRTTITDLGYEVDPAGDQEPS